MTGLWESEASLLYRTRKKNLSKNISDKVVFLPQPLSFHWRWLYAAGSVSDTNVGKKLTSVIVGIDNPVCFPCL